MPIKFNWDLHQENIVILGMQGSGKTTLGNQLLDKIPTAPRIIISPANRSSWERYGHPTDKIQDLRHGAFLWTGPNDKDTFDRICDKIYNSIPNCLLVIDDLQEYVSKQKIPECFNRLIQSGRNRGISNLWLSPAPNLISNYVLQSAKHVFAFKMNLESQIEWLERNYLGSDAWLLLPKERRKKKPNLYPDMEVLPQFAYLYRFHADQGNQIHIP